MKKSWINLCFATLLAACAGSDFQEKGRDVPTAGNLVFGVEKGDFLLVEEQLSLFHQDYPNAHLKPRYLCEVTLLQQLQQDSFRFAIMNRDLTPAEKENLEKRDILVRSVKMAETSVAVIAHPGFPVDSVSISALRDLLNGKPCSLSPFTEHILFDGACGSNYTYIAEKVAGGKIKAPQLASIEDATKLTEWVSRHPGSIAFISLNWIADRNENLSRELAGKVKVLKIENTRNGRYYFPFQSQIRTKEYPFVQQVYMHDLQGYSGLGAGFMAFACSQPGQIIVKKNGLIPARDHGRTILIETE